MEISTLLFSLALLVVQLLITSSSAASPEMAKSGCESKCGDVDVHYPFGNTPECSLNNSFLINCSHSYTPPRPYTGEFEIYELSLQGHARIDGWMSYECYRSSGTRETWQDSDTELMAPYTFSNSRNRFTAIGCDTIAFIKSDQGRVFTSGCVSLCESQAAVINNSCAGIGCCQTSIPKGLQSFAFSLESKSNHTGNVGRFNPCSYAFLVDPNRFNFSAGLLRLRDFDLKVMTSFPRVLAWGLGDGATCEKARRGRDYACGRFTSCYDAESGVGYLCRCLDGFQGNPYLPGGCQDVDECEDKDRCKSGVCNNLLGSYNCTCPPGTKGEYGREGEGCVKDEIASKKFPVLEVALSISLGVVILLLSCSWLYWGTRKEGSSISSKNSLKPTEVYYCNSNFLLVRDLTPRWPASSQRRRSNELPITIVKARSLAGEATV